MSRLSQTTLVVLAAGLSRRYGDGNKLLHPFGGRPLAGHIAAVGADLPVLARLVVCPPDQPALDAIFTARGFEIARNRDPGRGQASSLRIGLEAAAKTGCEAALICLADMPNVTPGHLENLVGRLDPRGGTTLVATLADGVRMPPVALSAARIGEFLTASGDVGGRNFLGSGEVVEAPQELAADFDTRDQFDAATPKHDPKDQV